MQQQNRDEQRRAQRALFGLQSADDIACADPHHPLAPRREDGVQEYAQFMTYPDRMVIDFPTAGDPDFTAYRINFPARALVQPDFVEKVERVMRGPGESDEAQKIGLAFVQHCRANPQWFARLQDAARRRLERGA